MKINHHHHTGFQWYIHPGQKKNNDNNYNIRIKHSIFFWVNQFVCLFVCFGHKLNTSMALMWIFITFIYKVFFLFSRSRRRLRLRLFFLVISRASGNLIFSLCFFLFIYLFVLLDNSSEMFAKKKRNLNLIVCVLAGQTH